MHGLPPVAVLPWTCYTGRPPGRESRASTESEFNESGFTAFRRFYSFVLRDFPYKAKQLREEKEKKNYEKSANRKLGAGDPKLSPCLSTSTTTAN
jgi:hypothetical protein